MRRHIALHAIPGILFVALFAAFVSWVALLPLEPLAPPDPGREAEILLEGVTVVNPGLGRTPNQRVVVVGERIRRMGPAPKQRAKSTAHPWAGAFMLPGLIDMHVHLPPQVPLLSQSDLFGFLFLLHGVTSIREVGSIDATSLEFKRSIEEGELAGPRVFACGPIIDGVPPVWPNSLVVEDREQGRSAVEDLAHRGVDCVNVYSRLSAEGLTGVREAAEARGLRVAGHVPESLDFELARLDDTQHLTGFGRHADASAIADGSSEDEQDAARAVEIARFSAENGLAHTPTLVAFERLAAMAEYEKQRADPVGRLLPRFYRDVVWHPAEGLPFLRRMDDDDFSAIRRDRARRFRQVRALYDAGVSLHVGTDVQAPFVVPGASLYEELDLLVEVGIPLEAAWAFATRGAGEFLGVPLLGTLQVGAPADLLIFREDPTRDLAALATLEAVMVRGQLYPRQVLDGALAVYQARFESRLFEALSTAVGRMTMRRLFEP